MKMFRNLRADEIDVRISQITANSVMLLLYKDARCDQNILDEAVGPMNWKRRHTRENKNCIVSIYDTDKGEWISKEDTGVESNTEAEKGLASDSFKRACVNWGIGRELYSSPNMWYPKTKCNVTADGKRCYDRFEVREINYDENDNITYVCITNINTDSFVEFGMKQPNKEKSAKKENLKTKNKSELVLNTCKKDGINPEIIAQMLHKGSFKELTDNQIEWLCVQKNWDKVKGLYNKKQNESEVTQ